MKSVLVVDDDRQVSDLLARWLESAGYQVSTCLDFEGARRRILDENGPPVLVVDVRLEGYNGIHLAILARQLRPDSRVVVLTGWDDPVPSPGGSRVRCSLPLQTAGCRETSCGYRSHNHWRAISGRLRGIIFNTLPRSCLSPVRPELRRTGAPGTADCNHAATGTTESACSRCRACGTS